MKMLEHTLPVCFLHVWVEDTDYKSTVYIGVCM